MRTVVVVGLAALLIAACGRVSENIVGPQRGDDVLFIQTQSGVTAVDVRTHSAVAQLPQGVPSADWKHFYAVSGGLLEDYDAVSGRVLRSMILPGAYALPVVTASGGRGGISQDGRRLVLEQQRDGVSHLLILNTSFTGEPVRVDLPGDYKFDAISNDGARLYLIQHADNNHYFVRDYVPGIGLDPNIIFDKSDGAAAMSGIRLMGVPSPDGSWLYSVYARSGQSSFVHELSLDAPFAFCVDLSGPGYAAAAGAMHWSLALNGADGAVYAVNATLGQVAVLGQAGDDAPRSGTLTGLSGATSTLVTGDGRWLVVGARGGVRWINASSLSGGGAALESWNVVGLAAAPGTASLFALGDSGEVAQLDQAGHTVTTFASGLARPVGLLGVTRFG